MTFPVSEYRELVARQAKRGRGRNALAGKEPRTKRKRPEHKLQCTIVEYLRLVLVDCLVFAIANGGQRHPIEAKHLKDEGVLAGIFDLEILTRFGKSFWLEVKARKGRLSSAQRHIRQQFIRLSIPHAIVRSIEDVRIAIREWGLPTREITE